MNDNQRNALIAAAVVFALYVLAFLPWGRYEPAPATLYQQRTAFVRTAIVRAGVLEPPRSKTLRRGSESYRIEYGQVALEVGVIVVLTGAAVFLLKSSS